MNIQVSKKSIKRLKKFVNNISSLPKRLNKKGRPPFGVSALFLILFILFSFTIIRETKGPLWDFLNTIVAQITGGSTGLSDYAEKIKKGEVVVEDAFGRCILTNPRNKKNPTQKVSQAGRSVFDLESKAGINMGITLGQEDGVLDYVLGKSSNKGSQDLGMSYILSIATDPNEVESAYNFIEKANNEGLMPIIRLCYPGGCKFDSDTKIINFYQQLNEKIATTDYIFTGVVGPNEPGTGGEMDAFGLSSAPGAIKGSYSTLVRWSNNAANALQQYRVENGGNMYIVPVAFNMSNTQNDDVKAYLYENNLNYDLFDYLMGNTYVIQGIGAEYFYDQPGRSIKAKILEHDNLQMLISETGYFPDPSLVGHVTEDVIKQNGESKLKASYENLCNDETVDGLMFFRPFPDDELGSPAPRQDPSISADVIKEIVDSCDEVPKKTSQSSSWLNCNFDSALYEKNVTFTGNSSPAVVASTPVASPTNASKENYDLVNTQKICSIYAKNSSAKNIVVIGDSNTKRDGYMPVNSLNDIGITKVYKNSENEAFSKWFIQSTNYNVRTGSFPDPVLNFEQVVSSSDIFAAVIMLGTNGCYATESPEELKANLAEIGNRLVAANKIPILSTIPYFREPAVNLCSKEQVDAKNNAIIELAKEPDKGWPVRFADKIIKVRGLNSTSEDHLSGDGVHIANFNPINSQTKAMLLDIKNTCDKIDGSGGASSDTNSAIVVETNSSLKNARPFFTEFKNDYTEPKKAAGLKVACSGDDCNAKAQKTVQVSLPIKNIGNNSAYGTKTKRYSPVCPDVAIMLSNPNYDALNQYAGQLKDPSGTSYPMPWLGSAIDCASQLKLHSNDFGRFTDLEVISNPGSLSGWAKKEAKDDKSRSRNLTSLVAYFGSINEDRTNIVADERGTCIVDKKTKQTISCFENSQVALINGEGIYTPFRSNKYFAPNTNPNKMSFIQDRSNYIPGPELVLEKESTVWSGKGGEVCMVYGKRKLPGYSHAVLKVSGDISCTFENKLITVNKVQQRCSKFLSQKCINDGNCILKDANVSIYNLCVKYNYKPEDKVYAYTNNFASVTPYTITDIYDALYRMYQQLQTQMSERNFKLLIRQNVGWRSQVDSIIRDLNNKVDFGPYLYEGGTTEYDASDVKIGNNLKLSGAISPVKPGNMFDNKSALAKGNPRKTQYQYYDWVGYFDLMQEWMMAYTNNTVLNSEFPISNPLYNKQGEPNSDREFILVNNDLSSDKKIPASYFLSSSILTCDQVEVCKVYSKSGLKAKFNYSESLASSLCPLDSLDPEKNPNGPAFDKEAKINCVTQREDTRQPDELAKFLCSRGYVLDGICNNKCVVAPDETEVAPIITGTYDKVTCPLPPGNKCFQGPYGNYTHCGGDFSTLPLDLYPKFGDSAGTSTLRDLRLLAPENGKITSYSRNHNLGGVMDFQGDSGVLYRFEHLIPFDVPAFKKFYPDNTPVEAGKQIGVLASKLTFPDFSYEDGNIHVHVNAKLNGKAVEPYLLYGQILGCYVEAPPNNLLDGDPVSTDKVCRKATGVGFGILNDNGSCKVIKSQQVITALPSEVVAAFDKTYTKQGGSDTPVASPGTNTQNSSSGNYTGIPGVNINAIKNPSCILKNDLCYQGPQGDFTHLCSKANNPDAAFDLITNGDENVYAPEDGVITAVTGNSATKCPSDPDPQKQGASYGGIINYLGDSGIAYRIYHVDIIDSTVNALKGQRFTGGAAISYKDPQAAVKPLRLFNTTITTTCWDGKHAHVYAKVNNSSGAYVDPYALFGDILKCGSVNSCQNDKKCNTTNWLSFQPSDNEIACAVQTCTGGVCTDISITDEVLNPVIEAPKSMEPKFNCNGPSSIQASKNYNNVYQMILEAAHSMKEFKPLTGKGGTTGEIVKGVDPAVIASILEIEYFGTSRASKDSTINIDQLYSGNPNQYFGMRNSINCIGPGQFCPGSAETYFGDTFLGDITRDCAQKIGVSVNKPGERMCPMVLGNAICGAMTLLKYRVVAEGFTWTPEQRYEAGHYYYGSCETSAGKVYCANLRGDFPGFSYNKYAKLYAGVSLKIYDNALFNAIDFQLLIDKKKNRKNAKTS